MMPKQRPGKSKQDYHTPRELLDAVKKRLCIRDFVCDLAASPENTACDAYITEAQDSLVTDWPITHGGWCWLNPPFANIEPWVAKAANAAPHGTQTVMLLPASVGANWWKAFVEPYAYVSFLNGRLCFITDWREQGFTSKPLYPKDCALLVYSNWGFRGHEIWTWSNE